MCTDLLLYDGLWSAQENKEDKNSGENETTNTATVAKEVVVTE
jgi:hypothetical protein